MADSSRINVAMQRLDAALQSLETALEGRLDQARNSADMEDELHRIGLDRSRLAQSLDSSEARAAGLEETNREVSRRLVAAMEAIRGVLQRHSA
ncbi:MAG: DUF4164 domain-containing protein [Alphaproteobacteria bacterium]